MPARLKKSRRSLPGSDDIHREVLPNGITVLSRANFHSASVSVGGYFHAGSLADPDEKLGLADFAISALMRGTARHSFDELYDKLESAGAGFGYDCGTLTTGFGGRCLVEDLPMVLDLLSDTLRHPTFPEAEVEKLRHQLLAGLAIRAQDTSDMADMAFDQMLFEGHPFSRPGDGWPDTIEAITRQDLVDFHARYVGPRGLVIVITGGLEPRLAVEAVQAALGDWRANGQRPMPPMLPARPPEESMRRHVEIAGKSQADMVIGTLGPRRADPGFYAAALGNSALGVFGMMGRIGARVREKAGLAYYAYSSLNAGLGAGTWTVSAGVNPADIGRASQHIHKELVRFVERGLTIKELADVKANFIGRLPLSMQSNANVASALINLQLHGLDLDYFRDYVTRIRKVTREQVVETARRYIDPERLVYAVAGPSAHEDKG